MSIALLQSFVPGVPMSASFLVGENARPWLIAVGIQRVPIRDGRFEYQGGSLPAPTRCPEAQIRPAIEAIAGLRGFVGVDFIWDPDQQHATILEINPRPTTSYVGLSRSLPPGRLAWAWLKALEPRSDGAELLGSLADLVHSQDRLSFDASGSVLPMDPQVDDGVLP
jgi:predicted ATP-grasp superfamily ATP-dependent carboligase